VVLFSAFFLRILALLLAQPPDIPWLRLRDVAPAHNLQGLFLSRDPARFFFFFSGRTFLLGLRACLSFLLFFGLLTFVCFVLCDALQLLVV